MTMLKKKENFITIANFPFFTQHLMLTNKINMEKPVFSITMTVSQIIEL